MNFSPSMTANFAGFVAALSLTRSHNGERPHQPRSRHNMPGRRSRPLRSASRGSISHPGAGNMLNEGMVCYHSASKHSCILHCTMALRPVNKAGLLNEIIRRCARQNVLSNSIGSCQTRVLMLGTDHSPRDQGGTAPRVSDGICIQKKFRCRLG
jgi:hypothetical protein